MSQMITASDLINWFTHHRPANSQAEQYIRIRNTAFKYAELICEITPTSREQSLAITKLEEVVFWATAAIARNPK